MPSFRSKNGNSIKRKLLLPMVCVVVIQALLFAGTIIGRGTVTQLNDNSFAILNERVVNQNHSLENMMLQHWSGIDSFAESTNAQLADFLRSQNMTFEELTKNQQLTNQFLENATSDLLFMLRKSSTTGAYIVLNYGTAGTADSSKYGVYIRNSDPNSVATDNSGFLFDAGASAIAQHYHISLNSQWNPRVVFEENNDDFFTKPYQAALAYPDADYADLGYWSKPFQRTPLDPLTIAYSLPLIDEQGRAYGVIGIDLTLDYLRAFLPYNDLQPDQNGAYVLAVDDVPDNQLHFETILSNGSLYKKLFANKQQLDFAAEEVFKNTHIATNCEQKDDPTYGAVHYFQLYNSNTPFESERWALIGLVEDHNLLVAGHNITRGLVWAFSLSLLFGLAIVIFSSHHFTKPIVSLVQKVRGSDPAKPVALEKIGISEIDELAIAIESLSYNVADSASKLAQIIDLLNMPIGAFEYPKKGDQVFCTDAVFDMLQINRPADSSFLPLESFNRYISTIREHPENNFEDIYRVDYGNAYPCWLKIKMLENSLNVWGIIMDVTNETLEKRRIEYERDYDPLTKLLNRRSFSTLSRKIFASSTQISVFVMWDLDNLKYVNDTYGHDYGDIYIQQAALVLQKFSGTNGLVSRISGDEFYVFLSGFSSQAEARTLIGEVHQELLAMTLVLPNGNTLKLSASAGMAWSPADSVDYEQLLKYADFSMYQAKHSLKGSIREFDLDSYQKDAFLLSSKEELDRLIENALLDYAFQPIVSAQDGTIFAYEALMRSRLSTLSSPQDILRLARYQSKLHEIERLTFHHAMAAFATMQDDFGPDVKIFINSIPSYIMSEQAIAELEQKYSRYLNRLVVEMIESEQADQVCTHRKMELLNRWQSETALDDFGAGYNTDVLLLSMTPNYVKIDMSIVTGIDHDITRQNILRNLLSYFKDSPIKVIAEGVETRDEMIFLINLGVNYLQGYYLSKPHLKPPQIAPQVIAEIKEANALAQQNKPMRS